MSTPVEGGHSVASWLSELHMECYKKNLEDYDTIKQLLELKDSDLKKLGISNSKDRSMMLGSLDEYKGTKDTGPPATTSTHVQDSSSKSLLRKGSLKKLNIKSLLGSSGSKKSKKTKNQSSLIVTSLMPTTVEIEEVSSPTSPQHHLEGKPLSSTIADYEELADSPLTRSMTMDATKSFHSMRKAIENEYVPSPENSPRFDAHRYRAHTIGTWDQEASGNFHTPYQQYQGVVSGPVTSHMTMTSHNNKSPEVLYRQQRTTTTTEHAQFPPSEEDASSPSLKNRHLSAISMESGLSFGYDVEKDFNPSFPLENQPWYHGKISRCDAESLLHDDGDFLIRENIKMPNTHTLSLFWRGRPDHTLIGTTEVVNNADITRQTGYKYHFDAGAFDTIPELIYNHLKYQIPIDKIQHSLIINPICRPGFATKNGNGVYATQLMTTTSYAPPNHRSLSPPTDSSTPSTLPRNFGSNSNIKSKMSVSQIETLRRRVYHHSNDSPQGSPRNSPPRDLRAYNSSGDLIDATTNCEILRNGNSPLPLSGDTTANGPQAISHQSKIQGLKRSSSSISDRTLDHSMAMGGGGSSRGSIIDQQVDCSSASGGTSPNHRRVDSFDDYELMESVSILSDSPQLLNNEHQASAVSLECYSPHPASHSSTSNTSMGQYYQDDKVKYAEIRYTQNPDGRPGKPVIVDDSRMVKYAEVQFSKQGGPVINVPGSSGAGTLSSTGTGSSTAVNPYCTYDIVPTRNSKQRGNTSAYQSRAELLLNKFADSKYSRSESSPHPFSQYSSVSLPRQSSSTTYVQLSFPAKNNDHTTDSNITATKVPLSQMNSHSSRSAKNNKDRESTASNDSALSSGSNHSASPAPAQIPTRPSHHHSPRHHAHHHKPLGTIHSHIPEAKVHKGLPGYEMLVKIQTLLQGHNNEELVYHLTRADAAAFLLSPRPGEDTQVWKDRVKQCGSSSGQFIGLQTLADHDGEKLWKKLYFRHLNLAQTVSLCIVTAGDAFERAKVLRRFIEIAHLLQSGNYGNLFSFISVMQGMAVPQITGMSEVWELLSQQFPEALTTHKDLMEVISNIKDGITMYATDQLTIPAIQHLKSVYHFSELPIPGFPITQEDLSFLGEYSSLCIGLDGVHTIAANTALFSYNTRRRLDGLRYDAGLMDFFMQDTIRLYLQSMSVHVDDPIERRRRFTLLLDALVVRVNSCESV